MVANQKRIEALLKLGILVALVIWANLLVSKFIYRVDLTEDKKYSISEATKKLLSKVEQPITIELYLEGEMPVDFRRLKVAALEKIDDFKNYSQSEISVRLVDPNKAKSKKARSQFHRKLLSQGIMAKNVQESKEGKTVQKRLFPGAMIFYGQQERAVNLLSGNEVASAQEQLNQSIDGIEFELSTAIRSLTNPSRKKIGIIYGHQELDTLEMADLTNTLLQDYDVYNINLPSKISLTGYDCIIISKPKTAFSPQDKFKIDQYLMSGGAMLMAIDQLAINMQEAGQAGGTVAIARDLNLRDLLFKYGLRVNVDLIQDLYSGVMPVVTGSYKNKPDIQLLPWPFFPISNNTGTHPAVKNIGSILTRFASSIDTVKATGVKRIPILLTSKLVKQLPTPVVVDLNNVAQFDQKSFTKKPPLIMGYLMEGEFKSLFAKRFLPAGVAVEEIKTKSSPIKMVVLSDGDILRNDINPQTGKAMGLGYDQYLRKQFANKLFIKNLIQYLTDREGIVMTRNNQVVHRPLDKHKVIEERTFWQYFNLIFPLLVMLLFGIGYFFWRRYRYGGSI